MRQWASIAACGRRWVPAVGLIVGAVLGAILPVTALAAGPAAVCTAGTCTVTFSYGASGVQSWTVPPGVTSATFAVDGAGGGGGASPSGTGGLGEHLVATVGSMSPGAVVTVSVGGRGMSGLAGEGGLNGGGNGAFGDGGGGFSEVKFGSTVELLAGGGGGGGFSGAGSGSLSAGGDGGSGGQSGASGGAGDSTVAEGATLGGGEGGYAGGDAGHPGLGGAGGTVSGTSSCGVANGSAGASGGSFQGGGGYGYGGGGGGGYVGGGQGGGGAGDGCGDDAGWGGGGGGSSFAAPGVSANFSAGMRSGDGQVVIAYPDPIVAAAHSYAATEGQTLVVPAASGVLGGAPAPAGDQLSASVVSGPANGQLTLNGDGSFTYTPASGYTGGDAFTYEAADPAGDYATATVTLAVAAPPTSTISTPGTGETYAPGQSAPPAFSSVKVSILTSRSWYKRGQTPINLTCSAPAVAVCRGTLTLKARVRRTVFRRMHGQQRSVSVFNTIVIGRAAYSLAAGKTEVISVRLAKGLPRTIHAQATASAQGGTNATRDLTLVPASNPTKHKDHH